MGTPLCASVWQLEFPASPSFRFSCEPAHDNQSCVQRSAHKKRAPDKHRRPSFLRQRLRSRSPRNLRLLQHRQRRSLSLLNKRGQCVKTEIAAKLRCHRVQFGGVLLVLLEGGNKTQNRDDGRHLCAGEIHVCPFAQAIGKVAG